MKFSKLAASSLLLSSLGVGLIAAQTVTADAATNMQLTVKHQVRLRTAPHFGYDVEQMLPVHDTLTVLGKIGHWYHVKTDTGRVGYVVSYRYYVEKQSSGTSGYSTGNDVPPGVTMDSNIAPRADISANWQTKFDAVLAVAQSKLGTPYIWGHNEDRGQYGFDCSNFTAYVYHHALGYHMSGASQVQASSVGTSVPIHDMRPGDLLIFNNGGHVGIYIGNGQFIEEGGGLGKVGYLKVSPGSYWYNHLTDVKRMF